MTRLQEWIHALEEGGGRRLVRGVAAALVFVGITLLAHLREFQNFSSPEAMDTAQLARNMAEGRGFTTYLTRPFSLYLLREHSGGEAYPLDGALPDISNAPLYPWALAQVFKLAKPDTRIPTLAEFDKDNPASLWKYEAEVVIAVFNQVLFFVSLVLLFLLGLRLFDPLVAWVSVASLAGADLFWEFSLSGLPTLMLMALTLALAHCLLAAERGANEREWGFGRIAALTFMAGALLGALALTRYGFAILILPALVFVGVSFNERRAALCFMVVIGFAAVVSPWIKRNVDVCGLPLGAAGFALHHDSVRFPGDRLARTLTPRDLDSPRDLDKVGVGDHWAKFWKNVGPTIQDELPKFGGSWISAFFLVGLLLPFRNPGIARLRLFVVSGFGCLVLLQILTRSQPAAEAGPVHADNLIVAFAPLVFLFGAAMFSVALDQAAEAFSPKRGVLTGVFCLLVSLPLILTLLSPRKVPLVYPPYHPPLIHEASGWFESDELVMSDMPGAVAWYGARPCLWLTWDLGDDFVELHRQKPIKGLYLTSLTMDRKLVSELWEGEEIVWGRFAANSVVKGEMPDGFPLPHAFGEWFPFQLLMADRPRWERAAEERK